MLFSEDAQPVTKQLMSPVEKRVHVTEDCAVIGTQKGNLI